MKFLRLRSNLLTGVLKETAGGIDNGSFCSPPGGGRDGASGGGHSGSDLGNRSSSKSSISASIDSSGKVGSSKSKFNFDTVEDLR